MKPISCLAFTLALAASGTASADLILHEPFAYPAPDLTGNSGGTGWPAAWTDSGNSTTVTTPGLTHRDLVGRILDVSGNALNTADGDVLTTISSRETGAFDQELWISMLIQPQNNNTPFFGASFYQGGLELENARFAIEHAVNKNLRLTRRAPGTPNPPAFAPAYTTTIGTSVFCVLHLVPDGGTGESPLDRIDVYFNPLLGQDPSAPQASLEIDGLQFDRIRIAAQNGRAVLVDEIRIGTSYADVSPHTTPADIDSDMDGLTDAQEIALGLDPNTSNATLIAAIRANASWFSLRSPDEISDISVGGLKLLQYTPGTFEYSFNFRDTAGTPTDEIFRTITSPPANRFLRLKIETP